MQAYYEIETEIPTSHRLDIQLPDNIPPGKAKIAIIYEIAETDISKNMRMVEFLNSLPDHPTDGLSREEIQTHLGNARTGTTNHGKDISG